MPFILISFDLSYLLKGHFRHFRQFASRKFFWSKPPDPQLLFNHKETNILSIALLEKSLQTEINPRGGAYIYIAVTAEEALPPALGTCMRP